MSSRYFGPLAFKMFSPLLQFSLNLSYRGGPADVSIGSGHSIVSHSLHFDQLWIPTTDACFLDED